MCCCNNRCSCESRPCDYLYFSFSYDTLCYVERVQVADAILILNYTATHHSASDRRLNLRQRTPPSMYCWQTSRRNTGLLNSPVGRSSSTDEGTVTATAAASTRTRDGASGVVGCLSGKQCDVFQRRLDCYVFISKVGRPCRQRSGLVWRPIGSIGPVCRLASGPELTVRYASDADTDGVYSPLSLTYHATSNCLRY